MAEEKKQPTTYAVFRLVECAEPYAGMKAWLPIWQSDASSVDQVVSLMQADGGAQGEFAFVPLSRFHARKLGQVQKPVATAEPVDTAGLFPEIATLPFVGKTFEEDPAVQLPGTDDDGDETVDESEI